MNGYAVTLRHDSGTVRIETSARDSDTAAALVCDAEFAPRSAVVSVEPLNRYSVTVHRGASDVLLNVLAENADVAVDKARAELDAHRDGVSVWRVR